jgi:DNA-binding transcriptional LysR family regulator
MELLQIKCFAAVADSLSYRKAGEALGYSTSHVSQQIVRLERALGVRLLTRSTHAVSLTPAGARVLASARDFLAAYEQMRIAAQSSCPGALRVQYTAGTDETAANCVNLLRSQHPGVEVSMQRAAGHSHMLQDIRNGTVDAGFAVSILDQFPGVSCMRISERPLTHLAMHPGHPLSDTDPLTIDELEGHVLLLPPPELHENYGSRVLEFLSQHSVSPHIVQVATEEEVVDMVSAGLGLLMVATSTTVRWARVPNIRFRALSGPTLPQADQLIWRPTDTSSLARDLVKVARSVADKKAVSSRAG